VISPANYFMLGSFVRDGFVAESQRHLLVKTKDGCLENQQAIDKI
jgi:hypothetical protein